MINKVLTKIKELFTEEELKKISKYIDENIITELSILNKDSFKERLYLKEIIDINSKSVENPVALLFNNEAKLGKLEIIDSDEVEKCFLRKSDFNESEKCCYILDKISNISKIREIIVYIP